MKYQMEKYWILLSENIVSGRNISTFKLKSPIIYNDRRISIIEIPSPKDWNKYEDWFEHIEFVIGVSFQEFMDKYPNIDFITKDLTKVSNPDIKIKYSVWSVKFHHNSLENVIYSKNNSN